MRFFFVSDLHGDTRRYEALFDAVAGERPGALLLGGDLLPSGFNARREGDFLRDFLQPSLARLRERLGADYPAIHFVFGNDDPRVEEVAARAMEDEGLWRHAHQQRCTLGPVDLYGYAYVPPTPFGLKDWERYDVSRYVDPGCLSPEEGRRTVPVDLHKVRHATIQRDLDRLTGDAPSLDRAIFLFHTPPHDTALDRLASSGRFVDHVPVEPHAGSIAVRRMIEARQPLLTLHGHIHESPRITGIWRERLGRTWMFSAAHDGPELALVRFDPDDLEGATREMI
jgi:Icc-related predicted phosphoesterase